jgi:hypothetical protein
MKISRVKKGGKKGIRKEMKFPSCQNCFENLRILKVNLNGIEDKDSKREEL